MSFQRCGSQIANQAKFKNDQKELLLHLNWLYVEQTRGGRKHWVVFKNKSPMFYANVFLFAGLTFFRNFIDF